MIHEIPSLQRNKPKHIYVANIINLLVSQKINNNGSMTIMSENPKYWETVQDIHVWPNNKKSNKRLENENAVIIK